MLKRLKQLRKEYGISQQRLADNIFVTQTSINKYENHDTEPEIEILKRLADCFDTTIDYLVGYSDQRYRLEQIENHQLTPREAHLIECYRRLSEEQKKCIENTVELFLEYDLESKEKKSLH